MDSVLRRRFSADIISCGSGPGSDGIGVDNRYREIGDCLPPPFGLESLPKSGSSEIQRFTEPFDITESEAREALLNECHKHAMWKKAVVKNLTVLQVQSRTAYHYVVETFLESRSAAYAIEPYSPGVQIDSDLFGTAPSVWDIVCEPTAMFHEEIRNLVVPNTTTISGCKNCQGDGVTKCFYCKALGSEFCNICNGTGMRAGIPHPNQTLAGPALSGPFGSNFGSSYGGSQFGGRAGGGRPQSMYPSPNPLNPYHGPTGAAVGIPPSEWCWFCKGQGNKMCTKCSGKGQQCCKKCNGSGQIRSFVKLTIRFSLETSEFLYEVSPIPSEFLKAAEGVAVFEDVSAAVGPVKSHPIAVINEQSKLLIQEHRQKYMGRARIVQQRHILRAIPVAEVTYVYGNQSRSRSFHVFGQERKVFVKSFPSRCAIL